MPLPLRRLRKTPRWFRALSALFFCCVGHNLRIVGTLVLIACAVIGLIMLFYDFGKGISMLVGGVGGVFVALYLGEKMVKMGHEIQVTCKTDSEGFRTRKRL
ncbi:MAG: hypothetical protein HQL53_06590 [Magnetococcales bacterium]|nr:hypothetical protein [Magnetococcales bacterium]